MRMKIGEILSSSGIVSTKAVEDALVNKREGQKIGDYLIEHGDISEEILYERLSEQLQIPLFRLGEATINSRLLESIDKVLLEKYTAFPVDLYGTMLTLAMEDPVDETAIKEIEDEIGLDIVGVFGIKSEILDFIDKFYNIDDNMQKMFDVFDSEYGDSRELQILDDLYKELVERSNLSVVVREGVGEDIDGYSDNLLRFTKKLLKYDEEDGEGNFEGFLRYLDNVLKFRLKVEGKQGRRVYWLNISMKFKWEEEWDNDLKECEYEKGLWIIKGCQLDIASKLRYLHLEGKRIIYVGNGLQFDLGIVELSSSEVYGLLDYSEFGDIFYIEDGWDLGLVDVITGLVNRGKVVLVSQQVNREEILKKLGGM